MLREGGASSNYRGRALAQFETKSFLLLDHPHARMMTEKAMLANR
jgi:hypothetical protein